MEWTAIAEMFSGLIAFIGTIFAIFRYFDSNLENVRREAGILVEKQAALDSRARHDQANSITAAQLVLTQDVERLKRETVKREDFDALEKRITAGIDRVEKKVDKQDEKLDKLLLRGQRGNNSETY